MAIDYFKKGIEVFQNQESPDNYLAEIAKLENKIGFVYTTWDEPE